MNNLNSCILEGTMSSAPDGKGKFCVATERTYKNADGEVATKRTHIFVVADGRLGELVSSKFEKNRGIRIVGRLQTDERGRAEIYAEHIEFKPIFKTAENN